MAQLTPIQILEELTRQMREDQSVDAEMQAIAAMSDAELDAELRSYELDPAQLEAQALAIYEAGGAHGTANGSPVQAVPLHAPLRTADVPRRKRPVAVAVWLAAAAVTATAAGGLIYTMTHPSPEHPSPAPPPPSPSASPSTPEPPLPPDLVAVAPAEERKNAAALLASGDPRMCLRLLDDARQRDPAGDTTPEVQALRMRAYEALQAKTYKKP